MVTRSLPTPDERLTNLTAGRAKYQELRCFCARKPLLATYGRDEQGNVYLHMRIYKQQRIFGEMVVYSGVCKIHCRECLRWHKITFMSVSANPVLVEDEPPVEITGA